MKKKALGNNTTSAPSPPKIPTKQNNMKKDKKKRQSTHNNVDPKLAQTPPAQCTQILITSPKSDDLTTNEPVPKISGPSGSRETVSVNNSEPLNDPNNVSQLEPLDIGSSDNVLLSPGLFGSDFYNYEENEIRSMSPSSSNEKYMMEMLEEFWNVENIIIEPNLAGSPTDLHFASISDCIGDWLL